MRHRGHSTNETQGSLYGSSSGSCPRTSFVLGAMTRWGWEILVPEPSLRETSGPLSWWTTVLTRGIFLPLPSHLAVQPQVLTQHSVFLVLTCHVGFLWNLSLSSHGPSCSLQLVQLCHHSSKHLRRNGETDSITHPSVKKSTSLGYIAHQENWLCFSFFQVISI